MLRQDLTVPANHASRFTIKLTLNCQTLDAQSEGYTPTLVVKGNPSATDASGTTYAIGSGLEWSDDPGITWTLTAADTATVGYSYWRLDLTDSDSNTFVAMAGNFTVEDS